MEHIHTKNMSVIDNKNDEDYLRDDLADAGDEELEDRLVDEARRLKRPLHLEEVARLSRNNLDT